jgi:hypothetical protein
MALILDYTDNLELSKDLENEYYEVRMALARLGEGLFWLHREVGKIELQTRKEASKDDVQLAIAGGILDNKPIGLLSCMFQWYAISACNYAQLVGWITTQDTNKAKKYVKKVMPRILSYRNKIAAHYAIASPRRDDNEADLIASIMTQVVYARGRLCAAAILPRLDNNEEVITVSKDYSWSLTLAHERLVKRYWPDGEPKSFQPLKIPAGETIKFSVSWSDLMGDVSYLTGAPVFTVWGAFWKIKFWECVSAWFVIPLAK